MNSHWHTTGPSLQPSPSGRGSSSEFPSIPWGGRRESSFSLREKVRMRVMLLTACEQSYLVSSFLINEN